MPVLTADAPQAPLLGIGASAAINAPQNPLVPAVRPLSGQPLSNSGKSARLPGLKAYPQALNVLEE